MAVILRFHCIYLLHTGQGAGDPHYTTLDQKYFDFMGRGDFVCFELLSKPHGDVIFQVQSRLYESAPWYGATLHKSLAVGNPNEHIGFEVS